MKRRCAEFLWSFADDIGFDVHTDLTRPLASRIHGIRWIHATTGAALLAVRSDEPCKACPRDRRPGIRHYLDRAPVTAVMTSMRWFKRWLNAPYKTRSVRYGDVDPGWINGVPFNRELWRRALKRVTAKRLLVWTDDNGAVFVADSDDKWRVAVMPLCEYGQPSWPISGGKLKPWPKRAPKFEFRVRTPAGEGG